MQSPYTEGSYIRNGNKCYQLLSNPICNDHSGEFDTFRCVVQEIVEEDTFHQPNQYDNRYFMKFTGVYQTGDCNKKSEGFHVLQRESKVRICHPYICRIVESFYDEKQEYFFVLQEYIEGWNLQKFLNLKQEILPQYTAEDWMNFKFQIIEQMLYAMKTLHEFNKTEILIDRDLKPDNCMIESQTFTLKKVDFDWAHIPGSMGTVRKGMGIGGTLGYMDPRAYKQSFSDVKMDIYSCGMMIYYILEEKDYFNAEEKNEYISNSAAAHTLNQDKISSAWTAPKYQPLWKIMQKMIAPVDERYHTVKEALTAYQKFLNSIYQAIPWNNAEILKIPEDWSSGNYVSIKYGSRKKGFIVKDLFNYEVHDIIWDDKLLFMIYNIKQTIYYILVNEEILSVKAKESKTGQLGKKTLFYYGEEEILFSCTLHKE